MATARQHEHNQKLAYIAITHKGARSSDRAIEELIKINGGLIWETSKKLTSKIDFPYIDDILSVCRISILKSLDTYKFGQNSKFVTWWVIQMRAAIQAWRREQSGELYLKQVVQDKKFQVTHYERVGNNALAKSSANRIKVLESHKDIELEKTNHNNDGTYEVDLKKITLNSGGLMGYWSINGRNGTEVGLGNIYQLFESPKISSEKKLNKMEIKLLEFKYIQNMSLWQMGEIVNYSKEWVRKILADALKKIEYAVEVNN